MPSVIIIIIAIIFLYALFSILKKKDTGSTGKRQTRNRYGKWIGGGLGWAFGGPIGAILGFAMGSVLDGVRIEKTY